MLKTIKIQDSRIKIQENHAERISAVTKIIDLEFRNDLAERLFAFSVDVIEFLRKIPDTTEARVIKRQLIKAATSGGANYSVLTIILI